MPLYQHYVTKERKRTVPGKWEDNRVQNDPLWVRITEDGEAANAADVLAARAAAPAEEPEEPAGEKTHAEPAGEAPAEVSPAGDAKPTGKTSRSAR